MLKLINIFKKTFLIFSMLSIFMLGTSCEMFPNDDTSNTEDNQVYGLEINNDKGINAQGVLTVTGDIKNVSGQNVKKLIITVIFYNDTKEELTKNQVISEDILLPDDSYHFKVNCLKKEASMYDVQVQGFS